jgi:hypothetical protein
MKIVVAMLAYLLPKTVILVAQPWSATPDALIRPELCGLNSLGARNLEIYGREDVRPGVQHEYRFSGAMILKSTQRALYKFSESVGALIGSWPEPSHGRISECPRQPWKDQRQRLLGLDRGEASGTIQSDPGHDEFLGSSSVARL